MKKIMFNDKYGLTDAVLNGTKTQTRRIVTPQPEYFEDFGMYWKGFVSGRGNCGEDEPQASYNKFVQYSPIQLGEIVAVAQRYSECGAANFDEWERNSDWFEKGFSNKMFVKSELMPHQIKITNVRVQRMQDITDEECIKEGIEEIGMADDPGYIYHDDPVYQSDGYDTPQEAYASLIDRISGKGTWDSNPYVFVYDFELVK